MIRAVSDNLLIEQIVGDRIPFTFGKRGSDTIPSGLQALGQFLSEDPRHYGVRLSALYTGGNYIQERGERNKTAKANTDVEMDSEDSSSSDFESAKSSSSDQSVNSVSSEEIANFDAQKWHREVDALLAEIQSKKEWETMAALREMYIFKDSERAADIVHVEALAELNDGELRGFDKTREELDTQVEAKQLEMLQTLSSFNKSLKSTTIEIIRRRQARKKAAARAKRFSFANMDEVVLVEKHPEERESDEEDEEKAKAAEAKKIKGNKAGEILEHISGLQKSINELVHDTHQSKLALEVHNEALLHLTLAMEAAEGGGDPPEAKEEITEILKTLQEEAKQKMDAEKKAQADALLRQAAQGVPDVSEESLKQQTPEDLKVMLARAEGDVQLLQQKVKELESARITQARGGADRIQKAKKAVQLAQQNSEKFGKGDGSPSSKNIRSVVDPDANRKKRSEPNVLPPHQLMAKLEEQLPAAQKALEDLRIHRDKFMASAEKAQQLRERLHLDPRAMDRRVSQPEVNLAKSLPVAAVAKPEARTRQKPKDPKPAELPRSPQISPEELERRQEFQRLDEEVEKCKEKLRSLSEHFSKVLGTEVGVETFSEDITFALLEDKESEQRQKQDQLAQLREELAELSHSQGGHGGHVAPPVPPLDGEVGPSSPTSTKSPRRASQLESQATLEDLLGKRVNPELMQQLLAAQGETLGIQEQLNAIEELTKVVRNKGTNLSPQEKQQIKELFGKPDIKNDSSSEATALREEKKKIRELEKQVGSRKDQWNNIQGASKVLRGLAEGNMTNGELMKKVRMVKAAYVRTGGIGDTGTGSTEMETLQAAAAMARFQRRRNSDAVTTESLEAAGPRGMRRFSETPASASADASGRRNSDAVTTEALEAACRGMRRFSQMLASARSGGSEGSAGGRSGSAAPLARSPSVEVDDLLDGPTIPSAASPAATAASRSIASSASQSEASPRHPPGGSTRNLRRRRSSGAQLAGGIIHGVGQVSLQVAVNMRRRHSLAAGVRAAQEQKRLGPPLGIAGRGSGQAQHGDRTLGALNLSPRRASV